MRVAVGSKNPVKISAVEDALSGIPGVQVESIAVDSGVPEQPWGQAETIEGAENRATRAIDAGYYDLAVGIEGGVEETEATPGLSLIMWAAVTDGDQLVRGGGPTIPLPTRIGERLHAGEELGPILDDELDRSDVAEQEGAAGVLTGNAISRRSALVHAVASALGPFVTSEYDR
ncbi:inosine/xanthosine triphosphatase [Natronoarchaeum sp. GCM10025703]|uniref:inosine/xanthosine triphosphatase n=1 Tax=unclassified Natronoarchaeum TaxID=2620183 RepID=UPI003605CB5B